jgi:protein-S-isoprenylcysteine O-methyltransferase Ste14
MPGRPILPPVYFLVALVAMPCLHFLIPGRQLIDSPLRYVGLVIVAAGAALIIWAAGLFRKAETTIKPFQESSSLVVRGPYRLTRNPMYLGMACILVGTGVLFGSASPFAVVPVFVALIQWRFIRAEEAALERRFGAAYREYRARVRRWV